MEWLANGLNGLVNLIEKAAADGAPIKPGDIDILKEEAKRLQKLIEGMKPQ